MVSMRDVAAAAGVSVKTVSRVHNGDPQVTPETRERVERAIRELGYLPNSLATTFREGRSPVIGVAVPDIGDPYFAALVRGLDRIAAEHRLLTVVASISEAEHESARVEILLSRRLQGLVLAPVSHDQSYLRRWAAQVPIVVVDREPERLTADWVVSDDLEGGRTAVAHLASLGHRRVAFVGDSAGLSTTRARLGGYRAALLEAGIPHDHALELLHGAGPDAARAAVAAVLDGPAPPTAIFSSNARSTMALAPLLRERSLAVVSFGDFPLADALCPSITALDQHPDAVGELAARRLLDRIARPGRRLRRRLEVPTTLTVRESSSPPSGPVEDLGATAGRGPA